MAGQASESRCLGSHHLEPFGNRVIRYDGLVKFPNGETRQIMPGDSSDISKAVERGRTQGSFPSARAAIKSWPATQACQGHRPEKPANRSLPDIVLGDLEPTHFLMLGSLPSLAN